MAAAALGFDRHHPPVEQFGLVNAHDAGAALPTADLEAFFDR